MKFSSIIGNWAERNAERNPQGAVKQVKRWKAGDCWSSVETPSGPRVVFLTAAEAGSLSRDAETKTLQVVHFRSFPVLSPCESTKLVQSGARTWLRWTLRLVAASSLPLPKDALHSFVILTGKVSHFYLSFLRVWLKASPATTFLPPGSSSVASHKDILSLPLMAITTCPAGSPAPSTKSHVAACPPVRWMRRLWVQGFWRPLFTCTSDRSRVKSAPPVFFTGSRPLLRIWS